MTKELRQLLARIEQIEKNQRDLAATVQKQGVDLSQVAVMVDRTAEQVVTLAFQTSDAIRIRYKAAREIREAVRERLETLGLPPEHFRSNFYAAMRRNFGGVNSYHDLPEFQVREIHAFIAVWRPTAEDMTRLLPKGESTPRVVSTGRRWSRTEGGCKRN